MRPAPADRSGHHSSVATRTVTVLTLAGAAAFWLTNLGISLTPIAAEYRAALSISYTPMLLEALLGGLILAFAVTAALTRFPHRVPGRDPLRKASLLSLVALAAVTMVVEIPAKLASDIADPGRYLIIGTAFNAIRILALGVVVGALAPRR